MLCKKIKSVSTMLLAIPLLSYSVISAADNPTSSDFVIRLFNNTSLTKPLHYSVKGDGQAPVEGQLLVGDNHGMTIEIDSKSADKGSAEVIVTDAKGNMVWDGTVSFYGKASEFYTKTLSLDSHYSVGANTFPSVHSISFDIHSQS